MNITLNPAIANNYTSKCQKSRVITEKWFSDNAYCPACPSSTLDQYKSNTKVADFHCPRCEERFQLKAKLGNFSGSIQNSAYAPKIQAIMEHRAPNYAFLRYLPKYTEVIDLFIVPNFFFSPDVIQKRNPLSATARRHGWIGSNILLNRLPIDARLYMVKDGIITSEETVRQSWKQFSFLNKVPVSSKGWFTDVLACVRKLDKKEFTLDEMYSYTSELGKLHTENRFVQPKIRQQLQVLRDKGILKFTGRGKYKIL